MGELNLYDVDKEYVLFLQNNEIAKRGFTRVPNMEYFNREQKFLCGIIMNIGGIDYYVAATSYKEQKSENLLIIFKNDKNPIKGSLRFNYMFPIPKQAIHLRIIDEEKNQKRKIFLSKQLKFFNKNVELIRKKAEGTYKQVINRYSPSLVKNSCDFKFLEKMCMEYCKLRGWELPSKDNKKMCLEEQLIYARSQKIEYRKCNKDNIIRRDDILR